MVKSSFPGMAWSLFSCAASTCPPLARSGAAHRRCGDWGNNTPAAACPRRCHKFDDQQKGNGIAFRNLGDAFKSIIGGVQHFGNRF
jgi:hypothetical protein